MRVGNSRRNFDHPVLCVFCHSFNLRVPLVCFHCLRKVFRAHNNSLGSKVLCGDGVKFVIKRRGEDSLDDKPLCLIVM
jgi:hypothetical protein